MFVERFMTWSVSAGSDQRAEAIAQLARTYLSNLIAAEDRSATEQVFILYLDDPCPGVRRSLALAMATAMSAPRVLVWGLSQDIAEVSTVLYENSQLLKQADLIHAIDSDDSAVQTAIAKRQQLSGDVVRKLVEKAGEQAVLALLENTNVVLGPGLIQDISDRLGHDAEIRNLLLKQDDLPPACRQMLVQRLSKTLFSLVADNEWMPEQQLTNITNDASNRAAVDIATQIDNQGMGDYVAHLQETNQLTPALLVRAICEGNAAFFETAIALISGSSLKRVQAIVDSKRPAAFRALFNRTNLPENIYPVIYAALTAWHDSNSSEDVLMSIISLLDQDDSDVDVTLFAMLSRMVTEKHTQSAQNYERQLLLAAA